MVTEFGILSGFLLGLASSLHCAGMCGPIASALLFTLDPAADVQDRLATVLTVQLGKAIAYVAAGGILGALGSEIYGAFDQTGNYRLLQWGAAASLSWVGLSVAGLLPPLSGLDGWLRPVSAVARRLALWSSRHRTAAPLLMGLSWGLVPCAMVFAALLTAMLSGSGGGGAALMAGFALGTVPAVTVSALGIGGLRALAPGMRASARVAIGLSISASGTSALLLSMPGGPLCLTP